MILRLCTKLAKKIHSYPEERLPLDQNPYADWSCRLFTADHVQYILVTNTLSLYSTILYGRGITDDDSFTKRVLNALRDSLCADGLEFFAKRYVMSSLGEIHMSKSLNPSVNGSMNDLVYQAKWALARQQRSPDEAALSLNEMPMGALKYGLPKEIFVSMRLMPGFDNAGTDLGADQRDE